MKSKSHQFATEMWAGGSYACDTACSSSLVVRILRQKNSTWQQAVDSEGGLMLLVTHDVCSLEIVNYIYKYIYIYINYIMIIVTL